MGGGLMQLVAYGAQDVYLTGNPQITFFKVVYRRHTNFSIETIEHAVDSAKPGGRYTVTVHRNGDLATNCALRIKLPALSNTDIGSSNSVAWVSKLGHALIKQVEIEIGGSKIDKHVGTWLDIWHQLTHTNSQEFGYKKLIGDVPELTSLRTNSGSNVLPEYTLHIPFQFWFCRNTGLALPLIALQYHEVRFHIELESLNKLMVWTGSAPSLSGFSFSSAGVMVDYIYLDSEERRRFAQVGHEYLIEQVQFSGDESLNGSSTATNLNNKFKLNFNHPCKEIVWALKVGAFSGEGATSFSGVNQFLTYSDDDAGWAEAIDTAAKAVVEACLTTTGSTVPSYISLPDGSALEWNADALQIVAGTNLSSFITSAIVEGTGTDSDNAVECVFVTHSLTLRDLSIPMGKWASVAPDTLSRTIYDPVYVVQHCNYGLRLDGTGNPVKEALLQLNGHDRFSAQEGSYFNYYQTRAHTHTPADGINVYSFSLHPENHQPSGTANLSRIDSTLLVVTFADSLRSKSSGVPILDWTSDSKLFIFAFSYNILRIMSGMAGMAYSN